MGNPNIDRGLEMVRDGLVDEGVSANVVEGFLGDVRKLVGGLIAEQGFLTLVREQGRPGSSNGSPIVPDRDVEDH